MSKSKPDFSIRDIAQIGMMIAVIEVCKFALSGIPNVELTSFWLIMFTLFFGWKIIVGSSPGHRLTVRKVFSVCSVHIKQIHGMV